MGQTKGKQEKAPISTGNLVGQSNKKEKDRKKWGKRGQRKEEIFGKGKAQF